MKNVRRNELYNLLGDLPPRTNEISARIISIEEKSDFILEKLILDLNGIEDAPAYFIKPKDVKGRVPAVLYNHAHGCAYDIGKNELLYGRSSIQKPPYAEVFAKMGYCALCVDMWAFGDRRGRTELDIFKHMLWDGRSMWGMMVYDTLRALDYLSSRPEVDPARIATMGISMGSTMAWWAAALDERIKVCADICCLTDFQSMVEMNGMDLHGIYYFVPGLIKRFSTSQINALIAPRPHLALTGSYDRLTPVPGLERINKELSKVYEDEGASDAWKLVRYNVGHAETVAMRQDIITFFKKWL